MSKGQKAEKFHTPAQNKLLLILNLSPPENSDPVALNNGTLIFL